MQAWFSSSELEDFALPGLPKNRPNIARKAKREGWKSRPREGRGGGQEYHIDSLPEEARVALVAQLLDDDPTTREGELAAKRLALAERMEERARQARREESLAELQSLSEERRAEVDAKLAILDAFEQIETHSDKTKRQVARHFRTLFDARKLGLGPEVYEAVPSVSPRSLRRWQRKLHEEGVAALAGHYGKRSDRRYTSIIDKTPAMRGLVLGMMKDNPHVNAKHVWRALRARFGREDVPSQQTVWRYITGWKEEHPQLMEYISNPDAWRSKFQAAFGSASEGIIALNQLWEMDSTPGDVMLEGGRHSLIGVIDVYSRRLKLYVAKTSTAAGIASLLRRSLLDWGIPEIVRTDQGQDYTSRHVKSALRGLGIEHEECTPFQPQQKPFIERAFRTFSHDLVEMLDDFIGHNVAERQAIENRAAFAERLMGRGEAVDVAMTVEQFQAFCDDWCDIYHHERHAGLDGQTPEQMVSGWQLPVRRIENERALDVLLAAAPGGHGFRTVRKKGIQISNLYYQAPELGAWMGQRVMVKYDEADAGRVYVFGGPQVEFICVAECPAITGASRQELAAAAKRVQKQAMREGADELERMSREQRTARLWEEIMLKRSEEVAKVHRMPEETEQYSTAELEAAARAADAMDELRKEPDLTREKDPDVAAEIERMQQAEKVKKEIRPVFANSFERFRWIKRRASAGKDIEPHDVAWYENYLKEAELPESQLGIAHLRKLGGH